MIESIKITDNKKTPFGYLPKLFANGTEFQFNDRLNVIIGPNGSGKSTIINLIARYTLCSNSETSNIIEILDDIGELYKGNLEKQFCDGVEIKADYNKFVCNMRVYSDLTIIENENWDADDKSFERTIHVPKLSKGQQTIIAFNSIMDILKDNKKEQCTIVKLLEEKNKQVNDFWSELIGIFLSYCLKNNITSDKYTMLLDEPDRDLDIKNIRKMYDVLVQKAKEYQIICVLHNPLLIYRLSKLDNVNIIELKEGYLNEINDFINL